MKKALFLALALCVQPPLIRGASLVTLSDLFNTGVDGTGVPLADGVLDGHYTFLSTPAADPMPPGPVAATDAGAAPIPPWLGDNGTSAWLTPRPNSLGVDGTYVYRTTFTIPVGVDPSQVFIRGAGTSDNDTTGVLVNGVSTGVSFTGNFTAFDPQFTIQGPFAVGVNTLDFVVHEAGGGPSGLRVEMVGSHGPVGHVAIPGIFNSGVNGSGVPILDDAIDSHWLITSTPAGPAADPAIAATAGGGFPIGPWLGDSPESAWIVPSNNTEGAEGFFDYTLNIDLTGLDPSTSSIVGRWALDNTGIDILLNGNSTGNTNGTGFGGWSDFSIAANEGDAFLAGVNTLTFRVENGPGAGPTGVRIEFLSATAAVIPEPTVPAFLIIGILLGARRRRRA